MTTIAIVVEGHGEVEAVPHLVHRIAADLGHAVHIPRPIRVKRDRFLKPGELERAVELAARQAGTDGSILILLDADDDCPAELAPQLLERAQQTRPDRRILTVLAKSEYESWFLAAAESIAGARGVADSVTSPPDVESIRDAKGWLSARMPPGRSYRPTLDQAALSARFDLNAARTAPSFDKLWRDLASLLQG